MTDNRTIKEMASEQVKIVIIHDSHNFSAMTFDD